MKISSSNKKALGTVNREPGTARYALTKHVAFWHLTFNGQKACFDHEQGAYYVAYLLLNPPDEPIHGLALEVKSDAYFGRFLKSAGITELVDPITGEAAILATDAVFEQRNLGLDENEGLDYLARKQRELEAILDDASASEPVKAEVERELEELYAYLQKSPRFVRDEAQKAVRAVREAIAHFHKNLAGARSADGSPQPVLRAFAVHLEQHLFIPSARYCRAGGAQTRARVAGRFTYEPPSGVKWSA